MICKAYNLIYYDLHLPLLDSKGFCIKIKILTKAKSSFNLSNKISYNLEKNL